MVPFTPVAVPEAGVLFEVTTKAGVVTVPVNVGLAVLALVNTFPFSFCIACSTVSVAATVPAPEVYPVITLAAFAFRAVCVAVLTGFEASEVLSTLLSPTSDLEIPVVAPLKVTGPVNVPPDLSILVKSDAEYVPSSTY